MGNSLLALHRQRSWLTFCPSCVFQAQQGKERQTSNFTFWDYSLLSSFTNSRECNMTHDSRARIISISSNMAVRGRGATFLRSVRYVHSRRAEKVGHYRGSRKKRNPQGSPLCLLSLRGHVFNNVVRSARFRHLSDPKSIFAISMLFVFLKAC